ncbi:MBL fold metallo-hydrolase [Leifsonia sp. AG29]|uniref:MBL fold metallo-hydrolase n=1 Tax=Leifsonia sp. AG29 TaxID=2598860 RepID=UPI00131DBE4B|nr:MBL fold metallo-hydrolase [Leifsonia sp. AG29]
MQLLTEGVYRLQRATGANAYLVDTGDASVVIDTGTSGGASNLVAELRSERGISRVTDIVLTHYDPDHAGSVAVLQRETGARVWMGRRDARILRGEDAPPTRFRRFLARVSKASELPDDLHELPDEGETEIVPGVLVLSGPGHTPGHVIVEARGVVFAGDSVRVSKGRLVQMPGLLTSDKTQALATADLIASRSPRLVCPGHGAPGRIDAVA